MKSAVSRKNFKSAFRVRTDNQRGYHTNLLDALHGLFHQLIVQHLKGMPFKGMQVRKRHLRPLLLSRSVGI